MSARTVRAEAYDVIGYDTMAAADGQTVTRIALGALNRALDALSEQMAKGEESEAIRLTITLEADMERRTQ